jgi:hypothetical protein
MFLFTTPPRAPEPTQAAEHPVARPVRAAAEATGVSFDYLMRTARRESGLNPAAKAQTSSAKGLFQFIEQTWLGMIKREGGKLGLQNQAEAIQQDRSGRFSVPDADARRHILNLRSDPELSARVAGVFTQRNREQLREQIGREPNGGELYMAHFLGAQGASELIQRASASPEGSAARSFPDAASANRSIFFDGKGRARTHREVYARLAAMHTGIEGVATSGTQLATATDNPDTPSRSPLAIAAPREAAGAPRANTALHGLFRGGGTTASADALRRTWSGFAEARVNRDAPSFFPRSEGVKVASLVTDPVIQPRTVDDAAPSPLAGFEAIAPVDLPLPPKRPAPADQQSARAPLDLTRYRLKR